MKLNHVYMTIGIHIDIQSLCNCYLDFIYVGESPFALRKGDTSVTVRAYCLVDGNLERQKRRRFTIKF